MGPLAESRVVDPLTIALLALLLALQVLDGWTTYRLLANGGRELNPLMRYAIERLGLARALCATLAGDGSSGMFTTALSATSQDPATHYISSGLIESEFADLLPLSSTPGQPDVVHSLALQSGMSVSVDDVTRLLAAVDVSEEPPAEALDRLGLRLSAEPEEM